MSKTVRRLFKSFQPQHYQLDLDLDRDNSVFSGRVVITGKKLGRPSQRLVFHQKGLKITAAKVTFHGKKGPEAIKVDRLNVHLGYNEIRLHTKTALMPGKYEVTLEYSGKITRQMEGLYPCFFKHDGADKQLLATQFESHHAREVLPSIDEPEAKATFQLSLVTPAGEAVVSNTPIASQKPVKTASGAAKRTKTVFEKTPIMSTYLLAFVTGELAYLEAKTKGGVLVRTYATPDNAKHTQFALDTAVKCLEFFNDYFDIDYPLEKCDLIALPDFASGAMENWGCITFREHALLVDDENTSLSSKQYVAMVVAHELAHQWFGNLVTMRWWTDLWLNEGFASWIEYLAVDELFPEWKMWTQFVIDEQQQALKLDSLENTHPVEVLVGHPDEIRSIFDAISYSKGASVIHMLYSFLGPENFKVGLRYYLKQHLYGNTDTRDLWGALEEASEKPVRAFMEAWTTQPGFPLLRANVEDKTLTLSQERFYMNPAHSVAAPLTWPIALGAKHGSLPALLSESQAEFELPTADDLKLNRNHGGFYRIAYNSSHAERLGQLVKKGRLSPIDRLGVLTDMAESAKAGYGDTTDLLHFLENFRGEDNYAVWDSISMIIGSTRLVMGDEGLREAMKPFIRELVAPQLKRLGWERQASESHFDRLLRPIILGLAASADEPDIVARCQELFHRIEHTEQVAPDLQTNPSARKVRRGIDIDPDLRGTVFGTVARRGGQAEFDKLLRLHNEASLSEERTTPCAALTGFHQPEIIEQALAVINSDQVRLQDVAYWIAYSFLNRHAREQTWQWLKSSWPWLEENLGNDLSFYRMPIYASRVYSDESFLKDYQKFFKPRLKPAMERSFHQGIEMIQWQAAWKKRDLKEVRHFFESRD